MHELPILRDIARVALKHAAQAGAERVVAVDLEVGELRDLDEEWMQRYFDFVTAGTAADGAELRVRRRRALFTCRSCAATFASDLRSGADVACTACASRDIELTTGNELRIESIDVLEERWYGRDQDSRYQDSGALREHRPGGVAPRGADGVADVSARRHELAGGRQDDTVARDDPAPA